MSVCGCRSQSMPSAPKARTIRHEFTIHGQTRVDDYYWLRERDNAKVIAYLEAENDHTKAVMKHTEELQERLFEEMKGRIKETDLSVPVRVDDYFYYTRTFEGKQYEVNCRKKGSLDAPEEVILDENALAEGHDYFRVGAFAVSPDHKLLAYSVDTAGAETYTLRIKNLETGELLPDEIENTYYSLEWATDNRTFFYTTLDAAKRPYKVFRHVLGEDASKDALVHHEADEAFFVSVDKTRSRRFITIELGSNTTSEVWYIETERPNDAFKILAPRRHEVEYDAYHHGDYFYIVTNDRATNFKLVRTPLDATGPENWTDVIPHRDDVLLDDIDLFADHLVVYEREGGLERLRIRRFSDGDEHYVEFPEPVYTFNARGNEQFDAIALRFNYESLVTPDSVFDYDMNARTRVLMKQEEVLGGFDPNDYESKRLYATASDGARIPMSMVYRKGMKPDGSNPLLLYGYGSYGATIDPSFSSSRFSLIDRGVIYVIAHIRGGQVLGRSWYDDGKLLNKRNTFSDFIACGEHLIAEKFTSRDGLAIMGGSAGGLLMGAVTNMRPDLFRVVVAQVPFVDVMNTMLDASIPLTVIEYEEWGNPNEKQYYDYMMSYSPYDNVEAKDYPNMLITAGLNDPRVGYWEPAKWTAKLRALKTDSNRLLLKTNMGAGHGGASGRYDYLKERAFDYAFILDVLGVDE
ncbi:MAG: S9 family peptidase [Planctomycetes bacterium]|nr:S9 family peptidase [Planctomycetota bacterium]